MSSDKKNSIENAAFTLRLIEVCGSSKASDIKRLLNISYQAAKNYLHGRLPSTEILMRLAEQTPYSIHWLLTGRGEKFVDSRLAEGAPIPAGQLEQSVRRICVEVINDMNVRKEATQQKIVVLQSSDVLSEKVMDEATALTEREP